MRTIVCCSWSLADRRACRRRHVLGPSAGQQVGGLSARRPADDQRRPADVRRRGHSARRRDRRRDRRGQGHAGRSGTWPGSMATRSIRWPTAHDPVRSSIKARRSACRSRSSQARRRAADQLQARRDAGLHAGRLQHRQLPRRGPRQGRLHAVAVRLRSGRRSLPADARDRLPPHQPGPAARKPAAGQDRRHRAAHRRQAVEPATANTTHTLLRWLEAGVPQDPADVPKVVQVELFPPQRRAGRRGRDAAVHRRGRTTPTAPTAT